ncbi:MAG: poly-beta-1,6 N-acetyl-D-glucosamine synthase [Piscirickettsiaceae bacterium]|nr:MAG: poly-beta-1,6 N-acetyl-D-glucosamine synthase [Piscirickettsiaceae bacterium]PCI66009.1 MAG: poly-beta-1,6 N-acetyl-D-glucosamine synthase [Piscirickettsiaceae bacterium]
MSSFIFDFALYYPLFMAYLWMTGALIYYVHWEKKNNDPLPNIGLPLPPVSILVPCHNEGDNARETIEYLLDQNYPDYEIIAINDASTDDTGDILDELARANTRVRVIHFTDNMGKAAALNMAAMSSKHDFLICIDGDALLDPNAAQWIMSHFINGPRVGAVTGNPRIRTRSSLLGKIQVGEFSAIIGMIKRAQRIYGRIFTVSGVVAGFRKSALHRVGYWSTDMVTDDIDISWKLQLDHWDIRFEPKAFCWILMPETYSGLFKQRVRWAQGGIEVLLKYFSNLGIWKSRRMWMVYLEFLLSIFWSFSILATIALWVMGYFIILPEELQIKSLLPSWGGVLLGTTCLIQFAVSLAIESNYEKDIWKYYYWMVWFPIAFWLINVFAILFGLPRAVLRKKGHNATWVSPDRGLREK